jgi:hypothetical protein
MECLHHIHHSGHFSVEHAGIDNCVLCQFQSLPFVAALLVVLGIIVRKHYGYQNISETVFVSEVSGIPSGRAPPYNL